MQAFLLQGSAAEGRGGDRNGFAVRRHADVELRLHVDAHAVLGDQRIFLLDRSTSSGRVFMFTGVMSWMMGQTKAPPSITTFSPRKPVLHESHVSFVDRRYSQFSTQ